MHLAESSLVRCGSLLGTTTCPESLSQRDNVFDLVAQLINIAKLVWAFDMTPGQDPVTGATLSVADTDDSIETAWTDGILTPPKPFPCDFDVRSAAHLGTINRECKLATENVFVHDQEWKCMFTEIEGVP